MAHSRPEPSALRRPVAMLVLAAALAFGSGGATAQVALDPTLPISLDADTSDFDRRRNIVVFTGLRISQGPLQISSDRAQASQIDFENAVWDFSGNVRIDLDDSRLLADEARLAFVGYRLDTALAIGNPAEFEDPGTASGKLVRGRAGRIEYDIGRGILRLTDGAWLAEGPNEITGATLVYNLVEERVLAEGDGDRVRITIQPPAPRETPPPADPPAREEPTP